MKKILVLILSLIVIFCFIGCSDCKGNSSRFVTVEVFEEGYSILVDKETRICYLENAGFQMGGITIMLDVDGKPLLYEGNLD